MKISLTWLKEYISIKISPEKLAGKLTMAGLEVERIARAVGGDTHFELEVTPNRPDCLNYLGIARELSAIFNLSLKFPKIKSCKLPKQKTNITIEDPKSCFRYIGTLIQNVNIAPSPNWLKRHLASMGSRAINNVVDLTNFCLFETGQPLHAFDFDKLHGGKIIVRRAKPGETLVTIDGIERKLDPSILVIADADRPVAIAGIMGGKATEVTASAKNILLESAYFDPVIIRRGARSLGLSSDSSYRFERGVDQSGAPNGSARAAALILALAGGSISAYRDLLLSKEKLTKKEIRLSLEQINARLGATLTSKQCQNVLEKLGCRVTLGHKKFLHVVPPGFRNDLKCEVDLIEEIARVIGYDRLPLSLPQIRISSLARNSQRNFKQKLSTILISQGFQEVITYTMIDRKALSKTKLDFLQALEVKNPLSREQEIMRPSLWPGLLTTIQLNMNRGQKDLRLFEIGKEYSLDGEKEVLALCLIGRSSADWRRARQEAGFYDLKGVAESLLGKEQEISFAPMEHAIFKSAQCARILGDGQPLGVLGLVSEAVLNQWDIKYKNIYLAEFNISAVCNISLRVKEYRPIPEYPAMTRDVSLAVKHEISFEQIRQIIIRHGTEFLTSVKFLEQYLGEKLPAGYRGLVFSLTFQAADKTLREEAVSSIHDQICQALVSELGAIRR